MDNYFNVVVNGMIYCCHLKKECHSYSLSCDDLYGNQIAFSTGVSEDTAKVINMLLLEREGQ